MQIITEPLEVIADGCTLTEGPRWRDGRLYFSDISGRRVCAVDDAGRMETIASFDDKCSGLGFLPNGDMLIVLMRTAKLMRLGKTGLSLHADLAPFADAEVNDMAVGPTGRAYVGQLGFDYEKGEPRKSTSLIVIEPDGTASVAANEVWGPNGIALSADGRTLYTAESSAGCITAFDVDGDGRLSSRRVFGRPPEGGVPDGICLDSEGGLWAGLPVSSLQPGGASPGFVRLGADGQPTHKILSPPGRVAIACAFGGPDRRTLYLCTTSSIHAAETVVQRGGRIERVRLEFTGAGVP